MKITKKILSVVITVMMIMSLMICGYAASFSDVESSHANYTAITTLADMGIINGYTDGTFKPDNAVTRAEMAKLISVLYGYDVNSVAQSPFTDVANDHWAVTYIATMKDVGIINGMGDGTFMPNNEVTYEQSLKMIVCALNWGEVAAQNSTPEDWSLGYRQQALRLGITKGVVVESNSSPAPRGVIAQLLYNSLDAKRAEKVVDANGNVSYKEGNDSVSKELSVYELTGAQIICTPTVNTEDNTLLIREGYIRLKDMAGKTYEMAVGINDDLLNYVGRYVDLTYQLDTQKNMTVSSYTLLGTESQIDLKHLKDVTNSVIEYYTDDNYERTSKITIENPTVVYNNRVLKTASDYVDLLKKDAGLTPDTNDQPLNYFGTIDVVDAPLGELINIRTYKSYYMSTAVDTTNSLVTLDGLTEKIYIPVKAEDKTNYEIAKKSSLTATATNPTSISITTNSVVSISMSPANAIGTKYIEYISNSSKQTVTPTTISTPYGPDKLTVVAGNDTLTVANSAAAAQFAVGSSTTYITDASGAIVYVTAMTSGNKKFGFFMKGKQNDDNTVTATFYDPENPSTNFTVTIQDESDISFLDTNKNSGALFWMNITNNKVKKGDIKLAKNVTTTDDTNLNGDVNYNYGDSVKLSSSQYVLTNATDTSKTKYATTNGTVIVRPDSDELLSNNMTYSKISLTSGTTYQKPEVYEIKKNNKTYVYLVVNAFKGLQYSTPIYVVKSDPSSTTGTSEDAAYNVECYNFKSGTELTTPLKIAKSIVEDLKLKEGDIFTFYDDTDNANLDVDKKDNLYILLRASALAADKTKAKDLTKALTAETTVAGGYTDGFRNFGIYQSNLESTYYSATLQLPVYIDREDSRIYFARQIGSSSLKPADLKTYVHGDDIASVVGSLFGTSNWNSDIVEAFGEDVISAKVTSSTRVYIYDSSAADGAKLTVYKAPSTSGEINEIEATLDAITTLENLDSKDASAFATSLHSASLTYGYFTSSSGSATLNAIVIIK